MKTNYLLFLALIFVLPLRLFAQYTFEKTIGTIDNDEGFTIVQCNDNGYFMVGYTSNYYFGYPDPYVIKTNEGGEVIWTDIPGNPEKYDWARAGIQTFDGGFAVIGYGYYQEKEEIFLIKYSSNGEVSWQQNFRFDSDNTPTALMQTSDSGFIFCGNASYSKKNVLSFNYPFVLKTNKSGLQEWFTEIHSDLGHCFAYDIEISASNHYLICGNIDQNLYFEKNGWLAKLNEGGSFLWETEIGQQYQSENIYSMAQTIDDGFVFSGKKYCNSFPGPGDGDIYLVKTDSLGSILWEATFDWGFTDTGADVDIASDGGFIVVGTTQDSTTINKDLIVIRTDEFGDSLWTKTFGGEHPDYGNSVKTTFDEGFILCGSTKSSGSGGSDVYLIKTDENGIMTNIISNETLEFEISLFPNPCSGSLNLDSDVVIESVFVYNNLGQIISTYQIGGKHTHIEFDKLLFRPGMYFLKIKGMQKSVIKKIILQ